MASSSTPALDLKVHQLDVACAELKSLHETRAVYEKRGGIFFRTTVKAAVKSQQKELEKAKALAKKTAV
ncbi:hypothetical protein KC19_4G014100 [Ceratodon purpureus]|uniref:Uncharacterized protein n=1 Tax=Ceratodon purpureus TaxID=3225 RepID=A0A8T0I454_CERPU|nr:hypothetical protein KC19_4G014100 [Ceratodon purpureus]